MVIDKETINDNHKKSITQRSDQKATKDEITTDVINKISSSSNQKLPSTTEHNITKSGHNNKSTTRDNDTKDEDVADKTDSYNNNNNNNNKESNSAKKEVFILGYIIIKQVKSYSLSKSLDNCKVDVKDFPGARVRYMRDYVRPTIRENPDHFIHVGTSDLSTNI